ncbi:MAG: glycosyltransferase family 2 protein [Micrococcales bacterium]|nr:glycosyltransferase family 2 protein [Micrococcales bacterium]
MFDERQVAVVVPAYNEERLISTTIQGVPDYVDHVIVVDDCSTDGTLAAARGVDDARVRVEHLDENQGVGASIVHGHRVAMELGAEIMVVMAGDDQMDPEALPKLLRPLTEDHYGFAKGNRFFSTSSLAGMPRHRVVGSMILTFLNKAASGYWHLVDPQNGYTAVTREALELVPLDKVSKRYEFENDLLIWLNIANVRAIDVPIPARYGLEESTIKLRTVVPRLSWSLFTGFWRRIWYKYVFWSFSPIALLLFTGLLCLFVGTGVGLWATYEAFQGNSPTAGTTVLSLIPFMCGFILLVQAFVLDIMESPD